MPGSEGDNQDVEKPLGVVSDDLGGLAESTVENAIKKNDTSREIPNTINIDENTFENSFSNFVNSFTTEYMIVSKADEMQNDLVLKSLFGDYFNWDLKSKNRNITVEEKLEALENVEDAHYKVIAHLSSVYLEEELSKEDFEEDEKFASIERTVTATFGLYAIQERLLSVLPEDLSHDLVEEMSVLTAEDNQKVYQDQLNVLSKYIAKVKDPEIRNELEKELDKFKIKFEELRITILAIETKTPFEEQVPIAEDIVREEDKEKVVTTLLGDLGGKVSGGYDPQTQTISIQLEGNKYTIKQMEGGDYTIDSDGVKVENVEISEIANTLSKIAYLKILRGLYEKVPGETEDLTNSYNELLDLISEMDVDLTSINLIQFSLSFVRMLATADKGKLFGKENYLLRDRIENLKYAINSKKIDPQILQYRIAASNPKNPVYITNIVA